MAIGSLDKAGRLAQVRVFARCLVWSGYLSPEQVLTEVLEAVRSEERDPARASALANSLVVEATSDLASVSVEWPEVTDVDRLWSAIDDLRAHDVVVLECIEDHWVARRVLQERAAEGRPPAGVAYFCASDVWHAVSNGMLEVNVWHADTANVAPGDDLLDLVLEILHAHGIGAHFDEGRIEADVWWRRRPVVTP
jgi:hypothetical protein